MGDIVQRLGNPEPEPSVLSSVSAAQVDELSMTRRGLLKKIAEWSSKGALVKQIGSATVGVASGGVGVYQYLQPRLRSITGKDFVVGDSTEVWLGLEGRNVLVKISRKFTQKATKTGYYPYSVACEGEWIETDCSMSLLKPNGAHERIDLLIEPDTKGSLSVIRPKDDKPIFVSKGETLDIKLVSLEKIDKGQGGYRLRLTAQFSDASFSLNTLPGGPPAQDIDCFAYAERKGQVLIRVSIGKQVPLNKCSSGIEYLISWVGRGVSV